MMHGGHRQSEHEGRPGGRLVDGWWRLLERYVKVGFDPGALDNWDPSFIRKSLPILTGIRKTYYRGSVEGLENIPAGPFMIVGPHGGGPMTVLADNLVLYSSFYEHVSARRPLYGMTHHVVFFMGPIAKLMAKCGAIEGTHANALRILRAGQGFVVYPAGEEDMARPYWQRNHVDFRGHAGFARVALEAGVPILPMGEVGGHETEFVISSGRWLAKHLHLPELIGVKSWPIALTVPWGVTIGYLPYLPMPARISMKIGRPMTFNPTSAEKNDPAYVAHVRDQVQAAAQSLVNELAHEH